jgi:Ca2+-binding RTX toxin-like protein
MSKRPSRSFRPNTMILEGRGLMTTGILPTGPGNTVPAAPPLPANFDTTLTVGTVTDHRVNPATSYILVDGSDYDDHIQVTGYQPGQSLTFQLEKWSNGIQLSSNTATVSLRGLNLQLNSPFQIVGRGGNDQIFNLTAARFNIDGGAGNDLIKTGSGGDIANGGDNNDTIIGGSGNDVIYGGNGDDYLRGGDGDDTIVDTSGRNLIYGDAGNDLLQPPNFSTTGNPSGDTIYGGTGNDTIYGGPGNDTIFGEDGNDTIEGEGGNDVINGGSGDDVIHGDNTVFSRGSDGNDQLYGGTGNDTIYAGGGDDYLYGDDGNDSLFGEGGQSSVPVRGCSTTWVGIALMCCGVRAPDSRRACPAALAASLIRSATKGAALVLAAIFRSAFLRSTGWLVHTLVETRLICTYRFLPARAPST